MADHLGPGDPIKDRERHHAARDAGFDLPARYRKDGASKSFSHVRPEYKTDRCDPGCQLIDLNVIPKTGGTAEIIDNLLSAIEQQHHQHEVGNASDKRGVACRNAL